MARRTLGWGLICMGVAFLAASLGQYGYMGLRQHQLRQQWNAINTPGRSPKASSAAVPAVRLVIPSIHLDDAVVRGTTYEDLLVAPGLLEGTPLPGRGGNTVIAGHRDTFFRHVADLRKGDEIVVRSAGATYRYAVTGQKIVRPSQTSVLDATLQPELTLVTCYPTYWIGPAPERLIVQAVLAR